MPTFDKAHAHALVVEITQYQHIRQLPKVEDAAEIVRVLTNPNQCGYLPENVRLLQEEKATLLAIKKELDDLAARSRPESAVFIYFSGHGGRIGSGEHAGQYLLPFDVEYPDDAKMAATAIRDQEFTAALKKIPAQKALVVLDCCHAGGIGQPKDARPPKPVPPALTDYDILRGGEGRVILASSRVDELSWVLDGAKHGLFTEHLLAGLGGEAASDDGFVRVFDLFEYVQPKVTAARPNQRPYFKGELDSNFPVVLYKGGQKGAIPRTADGFRYDVYISYVDRPPDGDWVWDTLVPRLKDANLRVAVSDDVLQPGIARVVGTERAIRESRRIVLIVSELSLRDGNVNYESVLGITKGIKGGTYPLIPVFREPVPDDKVPLIFSQLAPINLAHPNANRAKREFDRLIEALNSELPRVG